MRKSLPLLAFLLLLAAAVLFVTSFDVEITSLAQNANTSKTTNKNQNDNSRSILSQPSGGGGQPDFSKNTWELPADADKTPNPVPATAESIAKGKELYLTPTKGNCIFCHGETGAGNEENIAKKILRRKPADLTNKDRMTSMTDGELFWKITKGITGIMPPGERKLPLEEDRWHVVNYIRTLAKNKE